MKQFITIKTAAQTAGVSTRTVFRWIHSGQLPYMKISARLFRIDPEDLTAFLNGHKG